MELLPDDLRRQLPPIRKIHNPAAEGQCMIYARLFTQRSGVSFYVAEGEQRNTDYLGRKRSACSTQRLFDAA